MHRNICLILLANLTLTGWNRVVEREWRGKFWWRQVLSPPHVDSGKGEHCHLIPSQGKAEWELELATFFHWLGNISNRSNSSKDLLWLTVWGCSLSWWRCHDRMRMRRLLTLYLQPGIREQWIMVHISISAWNQSKTPAYDRTLPTYGWIIPAQLKVSGNIFNDILRGVFSWQL